MDYKDQIDIASSDQGSKVIYCSDEFFADSSRMLQANDPVWIEGKYDENGKWMDGWESRRRRDGKMIFVLSGLAQPLLLITLILTQLTLLETLRPEFQS